MLSRHTAPVSFDLMLLDPDTVPTIEGIYEVLESDAPEVPLTTRMQAAIDECSSRWPAYDEAGNEIETPWASWPLARAMELPVIELNIGWNHAATMLSVLIDVAQRHDIVLYDPQTDEIHFPPRLASPT